MKKLFVIFFVTLLFPLTSFSVEDSLNFSSPQIETNYHELTQQLRCPQCQNNSIADSNAGVAEDMRLKVIELLEQGKSKQEIIDYMVQRYGNFVTYDPPMTASTSILWIAPLIVLLLGFGLITYRRQQRVTSTNKHQYINKDIDVQSALSAEEQQRLKEIFKKKKD